MSNFCSTAKPLSLSIFLLILAANCQGAAPRFWTTTPYRVKVLVALTGPTVEDAEFARALNRELSQRLSAGARPLWDAEVELAVKENRDEILSSVSITSYANNSSEAINALVDDAKQYDKLNLVSIRETSLGFQVEAIEHDITTKRWSAPANARVVNLESIPSSVINVLKQIFSPLASFEIDTENTSRVKIVYRGSQLQSPAGLPLPTSGDVLVPYLRRVDRTGAVLGDGAQRAPWTYLVAEPVGAEENVPSHALIHSHKRTPFGSRRRGRVEQIALTISDRANKPTLLKLHDQADAKNSLAGYEVFATTPSDPKPIRLGRTDLTGVLLIPSSEEVRIIHIKCGSSVVASIPVLTGVDTQIEVPLLDESQRLAAEAKASALREELVDLVAVRRILAGRIRQAIEAEDLKKAQRLLDEYDELPGMAQFRRRIDSAEQLYRADHPIVQRRLDRVFTETRSVLGSSLSAKEASDLALELQEARNK